MSPFQAVLALGIIVLVVGAIIGSSGTVVGGILVGASAFFCKYVIKI